MTVKKKPVSPFNFKVGSLTRLPLPQLFGEVVDRTKRQAQSIKAAKTIRRLRARFSAGHDVARMIESREFTPQAVIRLSIETLSDRLNVAISEGVDDFDTYKGLGFKIHGMPFTILHYKGHPEGTSTIYLPSSIKNVGTISDVLRGIFNRIGVEDEAVSWQRKDDPDL